MFRKSFVKTVATLALGMMIGSATVAMAAPSSVQAIIAKFAFTVDGKAQTLKNDPLVYNGTTYLPVREVAGMLNADVTSFDNKTKKIELQTKQESKQSSVTVTPTTETKPEKTYSVGDTIETDNFKLKIDSVSYGESHDGLYAYEGETLAIVKFEVLVDTEPKYSNNWLPVEFIDFMKLDNGKELIGNSFTTDRVTTKQWSTVHVLKSIPKDSKVVEVKVADPVAKNNTLYTVKIQ